MIAPREISGADDHVGQYQGFADTVGDLVGQSVFDLESPIAVVDQTKVRANIHAMNAWCAARGAHLAPHTKTTMAPKIIEMQRQAGVWGFTVATVQHLRALHDLRLPRLILANELASAAAAAQVLTDNRYTEILVFVDSLTGIDLLADAARQTPSRPLGVLLEVGVPGGRAGVRSQRDALRVAEAASNADGLVLRGVAAFEGILGRDRSPATHDTVASYLDSVAGVADRLIECGLFHDSTLPPVISAGGSAYFDIVVDRFTELGNQGAELVLRSGCYVTHDSGLYNAVSPLGPVVASDPALTAALHVWAQVISQPEPHTVVLNAGRRDVSTDIEPPHALRVVAAKHPHHDTPVSRADVLRVSDHHLVVRLDQLPIHIGDWVQLGVSHPCTTFDKWRLIVVTDRDTIVDLAPTRFT